MTWSSAIPLDTWKTDSREFWQWMREIRRTFSARGQITWNPPNVPAASTVDTVLDVLTYPQLQGLREGNHVFVTPPSTIDAGLAWGGLCAADDTLTIRLTNVTAGGINPESGTWKFMGVL